MDSWFENLAKKYFKSYYDYDRELHTYKKMGNITIEDNILKCSIEHDRYVYNRISIEFKLFSEEEKNKIAETIDNNPINKYKVINKTLPDELFNLGIKIFPTSLDDFEITCSLEYNLVDIISVLKFFNRKLQNDAFLIFKIRGLDLKRSINYDINTIEDIFNFNFKSSSHESDLHDLYDVNITFLADLDYPTHSFDFIYTDLFNALIEEINLKHHISNSTISKISERKAAFNVDSNYNLTDMDEKDLYILMNEISTTDDADYSWKFSKNILDLTYELVKHNTLMPQLFLNDNIAHIRWIPSFFDSNVLNLCRSYYSECPDNLLTFDGNEISHENQVVILISLIMKGLIDYYTESNDFIISERKISKINRDLLLTKPKELKTKQNNVTVQKIAKKLSIFYLKELDYEYAMFVGDDYSIDIKIKKDNKYKVVTDANDNELKHLSIIYDLFTQFDIKNTIYEKLHLSNHEFKVFIKKIKPLLEYINVELNMPFEVVESGMKLILDTNLTKKNFNLKQINNVKWLVELKDNIISLEEFDKSGDDRNEIIKVKNKCYVFNGPEYRRLKSSSWSLLHGFESRRLLQMALLGKFYDTEFELSDKFKSLINVSTFYDVPESLTGELRPYQKIGYSWLVQNIKSGFGSILADDMGLGKTVQVLSAVLYLKENSYFDEYSVLIIVPPTLISNWEQEILKFTPDLTYYIYHGSNRVFPIDTYDIVLTSYGVIRNDLELFSDSTWLVCVIDEAQNIKNPNTQQTKSIKSIDAFTKIALTGTPIENRLMDYWSIFDFVNKGYLSTVSDFKENYIIPIERLDDKEVLNNLKTIAKPFVLRRLKTDENIKKELPEKFVNNIYCTLTKKQIKLYNLILDGIFENIESAKGIERKGMILKTITGLKQACNHPAQYLKTSNPKIKESGKMELLIDITENILDVDEKVIIFTQYVKMGEIIQNLVSKKFKTDVLFLHGSQTRSQKSNIIDTFQNDSSYQILVATLKTGGTGLNLTAAQNVIHYDLWWNPAVENQATDRVHRIGQENDVMVYRFITKGTLEEEIDRIVKNKIDLAGKAISNDETFITEMSNEELRKILSLRL